MIRRLVALLLLLALIPAAAFALGPTRKLPPDAVLRARYVQERHLAGFDAPLKSSGDFILALGRGLIWRATTPFAMTTAITAKGMVQNVGAAETMRLSATQIPFLGQLYAMLGGALAGDWQGLDADFTVTQTGDDQAWQITLAPLKALDPTVMPYKTISVKGAQFVDQVDLVRANGDFDELTFQDQQLSTAPLAPDEADALDSTGK